MAELKFKDYLLDKFNVTIYTEIEDYDKCDCKITTWDTKDGHTIYARTNKKGNLYYGTPDEDIVYDEYGLGDLLIDTLDEGVDFYVDDEDYISKLEEELEMDFEEYKEEQLEEEEN